MANQKSLDKKKTSEIFEGVNSTLHQAFIGAVERDKNKPKELEWELTQEQKGWLLDVLNTDSDNALKVILINGLISKLITQQRTELLEEYFDKEDNLIDKHANLKDDNWDKFLEARSKLKINLINKKDE